MYIILLCSQSYEVGLLSLFLVMGRVRPGEFKQTAQYLKSRQSEAPKDAFLTITQDCTFHGSFFTTREKLSHRTRTLEHLSLPMA